MSKKKITFIVALTVAVVLVLSVFIGYTIQTVNRRVMQDCFDELGETARRLADDLCRTIDMDRTLLKGMSQIIASGEGHSDEALCEVLSSFDHTVSYLSYVELLRPDGTMLDADGATRDVSATFTFAEEAEKGAYISDISQSTRNPDSLVVRSAMPVLKNGQTMYMLYGVVALSDLPDKYKTDIYEGHAYVYVVNGDTGDFLLDTWHKSLGNLSEMGSRETLPGYSMEEAVGNMKYGISGEIGFLSRTTGNVLYMRYEPIGVNNWSILLTVEQSYAMKKSMAISKSLYVMAGVIGAVMLLYIACVIFCLLRAYWQVEKLGTRDQNTGLLNRNAYDQFVAERQKKTFSSIVCVYLDANGLHEINNRYGHAAGDQMLRAVADALKSAFADSSLYRIGGDEFIAFREGGDMAECETRMKDVTKRVEAHGYSVSFGVVCRVDETGLDRVIREADELMLENKQRYYEKHGKRGNA